MLIGVDLVEIDRLRQAVERTPGFLLKVYTEVEINYCHSKKNPYPSLAARFAAKEAVRKLSREFQQGVSLSDIEVKNDSDGKPSLLLHGLAAKAFADLGFSAIELSLSHTDQAAVAMVVVY